MNILNLIRSTDRQSGGPIEGVYQNASALAKKGHHTQVVTLTGEQETHSDLNMDIIPFASKGSYGFSLAFLIWTLRNAHRYDLVIVHGLWQFQGLSALLTSIIKGIPYVIHPHGMLDPWFKKTYPLKHLKKLPYWLLVERWVLHRAKRVLFTAELERELAQQTFPFYRCREAIVSYGTNAYEESKDLSDLFFKSYPSLQGKHLILFMSRIHPKKGCDLLLKAFSQVNAIDPELHLVMAGPDQMNWKSDLLDLAKKLGISERITWTGMLKGKEKFGAFDAARVMILPSHQENFGIVVAEALSRSKPVLITDKINIFHEVESHKAGLVETDTLEGCRQLLERWLNTSKTERAEMNQNALQCFKQCFDLQLQAEKILKFAKASSHD